MKNLTFRSLAIFLAAFMALASLTACDKLLGGADESTESTAVVTKKPAKTEKPKDEDDEEDDEDEENTNGDESNTEADATVTTENKVDDSESVKESENTSASESDFESDFESAEESGKTESTETATGTDTDGRFDYMSADMSEYVSVDESLYKNTTVTLPAYLDGSDEAVAAYIKYLCELYPTATGNKITDQPIKNGDKVAIYYEGWLDGKKFDGGSNMNDASPYELTIGSGTFIPGFEEGLIGLVPNTTSKNNPFDLHVTFPENYGTAYLAGQAVVFKVYVVHIVETAPAEYTEDFIANTLGYTAGGSNVKAAFEKYLKEEHLPEMNQQELSNSIWTNLMEKSSIKKYPEGELDYYFNSYTSQYKAYYEYYSSMFPSFDAFMAAFIGANWKTDIEEQCEFDVKQSLIFHAIAQNEGITITDTDYQNAIQYYIDYYGSQGQNVTAEQIEEALGERMIKEQALWDKVNALIVENCIVVYE